MMDVIMISIIAGCMGLVALLAVWCQKQIKRNE